MLLLFRMELLNVLLSPQVNWHDFAFFDPVMYESLRQLIRHSQAGEADAVFAAMDLAFAIDLCKEEGAGQVGSRGHCVAKCTLRCHPSNTCAICQGSPTW